MREERAAPRERVSVCDRLLSLPLARTPGQYLADGSLAYVRILRIQTRERDGERERGWGFSLSFYDRFSCAHPGPLGCVQDRPRIMGGRRHFRIFHSRGCLNFVWIIRILTILRGNLPGSTWKSRGILSTLHSGSINYQVTILFEILSIYYGAKNEARM